MHFVNEALAMYESLRTQVSTVQVHWMVLLHLAGCLCFNALFTVSPLLKSLPVGSSTQGKGGLEGVPGPCFLLHLCSRYTAHCLAHFISGFHTDPYIPGFC